MFKCTERRMTWEDEEWKKLKLGDAHVTPRYIQEVQASKLGDAQGIPFFINKNIRAFLNTLYFYCFIYYVLFLERLFSVCLVFFVVINKLDPSIIVWERDTLRFFMWILVFFTYIYWVFLTSYCNAFSSCFSCISCQTC